MDPRKLADTGLDLRLLDSGCAYCGGPRKTRDHVPSRILLDDPLPPQLPVVPACVACNRGFSLDEEYLACIVECVLAGSTNAASVARAKVADVLMHTPRLAEQIGACRTTSDAGTILWSPDLRRIENVLLKLARGHALYELATPKPEAPMRISCVPLVAMTPEAREGFENGPAASVPWPEIGSRAFLRAAGVPPYGRQGGSWVDVQTGRYRYSVFDGPEVRIVLSEYLAVTVAWT